MVASATERIRFYGRRKGRPLSQNMQRLLDEVLPDNLLPEDMDESWLSKRRARQGKDSALTLEIGFGGGEHLASLAAGQREDLFIGAEPFINGVVSLLRHIEEQKLINICVWPDDVRLILDKLPTHSLSAVYVMFPDPWPKARHAGRRILNQELLDRLADLLKPKGSFVWQVTILLLKAGYWPKPCATPILNGVRAALRIGANAPLAGRKPATCEKG